MPPADAAEASVPVQLAHLTGRIDQVLVDYERRLSVVERRQESGTQRAVQVVSPVIAAIALVLALADRVAWH